VNAHPIKIAVLGAGSWGIALANHCSDVGHHVSLWEFDPQMAQRLHETRERPSVLPGARIRDQITITSDLGQAVHNSKITLLVVPSHVARSVIQQLTLKIFPKSSLLISCTKGIENGSHLRISEIVKQELSDFDFTNFAVLSGPSHAEEVSKNIPTAVVVAAKKDEVSSYIQKALNSRHFRIYRSHDVVGVELGGALKNVIAIAAGICDGAGFGDNTKAALQPRGLAEIARLGRIFNADPLTFAGLSGMGDLIVTCMSRHSRNRFVGEQIGRGKTLQQVLDEMVMVAEGVRTCKSAVALAEKHHIDMPISREVYSVLFNNKEPKKAMEDLMGREVKPEVWF